MILCSIVFLAQIKYAVNRSIFELEICYLHENRVEFHQKLIGVVPA